MGGLLQSTPKGIMPPRAGPRGPSSEHVSSPVPLWELGAGAGREAGADSGKPVATGQTLKPE